MKYSISHRTTYAYRSKVALSHHLLHLTPRNHEGQRVLNHSLLIEPAPITRTDLTDDFGNPVVHLRIAEEHSELIVHARSTVEIAEPVLPDLAQTAPWESVQGAAFKRGDETGVEVLQFTCRSRQIPASRELVGFARPSFPHGRPVLEGALDLTLRIHREFKFDATATDVSTPVAEVLKQRRGVCQDFAHLAIAALRTLGIPARYVSGYLLTHPPPGKPKLQGADASHAWLSVWAPETGWVDFDPTNGLIPRGEHITTAYGRDYDDVSPISGVLLGGGSQSMTVAVDVDRAA